MPQQETCKAAVFHRAGSPLTLTDVDIPDLLQGETLVRVDFCTICGSDLHTFHGDRSGPTPSILGHEIIGIVERVANAKDTAGSPIQVGDRITWSVACSCGQCNRCDNNIQQKCESLFKYGHEPLAKGLSGGLAEMCLLREGTAIVKLPRDVPSEVLCPANCATATVAAAVRTAGSLTKKRVLIFGAGMLGLTTCAFAKSHRAANICICDPNVSRHELANSFGAARVCSEAPAESFDIVLEMSGSPDAVEAAVLAADIGGIVVLVGSVFPTRSVEIDPEQVVRRLLSIHGIHNYRPEDLEVAVQFLTENHSKFPFADLVASSYPLNDANAAFEFAARERPIRVAVHSSPQR